MSEDAPLPSLASVDDLRRRFEARGEFASRAEWEAVRVELLGRKGGLIRNLLESVGRVSPAERKVFGLRVNELKRLVETRLAEADERLRAAERSAEESLSAVDVTLPGRSPLLGSLHPVTLAMREIEQIFAELGYSVAEGPEAEDDFHNFAALNFPADHPARDTQDTFFLEDGRLLRTHTSPVQIRTMLSRTPPIRIICPGRVYRHDNDLRHSPMFHQIEGLCVAEGISFADLKGTLDAFLRRLFSADTKVRLRPSYFPFTEPSAEVDVTCQLCKGKGCATCSGTGWMEILGSGMVDPRVLRNCGIDPRRYSGFAFGMGVERTLMFRHGVRDMRDIAEGDVRFTQMFGTEV
jgi:phenylalanyl-tRNA synthetase alpha chain